MLTQDQIAALTRVTQKRLGRRRKAPTNPVEMAVRLIGSGDAVQASQLIGIHLRTLYRFMQEGNLDSSPHWLVRKISRLSGVKKSMLAPRTYDSDED